MGMDSIHRIRDIGGIKYNTNKIEQAALLLLFLVFLLS